MLKRAEKHFRVTALLLGRLCFKQSDGIILGLWAAFVLMLPSNNPMASSLDSLQRRYINKWNLYTQCRNRIYREFISPFNSFLFIIRLSIFLCFTFFPLRAGAYFLWRFWTALMACQVADHLEPWQDLEGKVVLVTGASSGLGSEFCLNLAKAGCKIVAAARRVDRLKSLCDEINNLTHSNLPPNADRPVRAVVVELDVTSGGSSISASVQKAWEAFGRIDVLLNNAGIRGKFWFCTILIFLYPEFPVLQLTFGNLVFLILLILAHVSFHSVLTEIWN